MFDSSFNPYASPSTIRIERGEARLRLRSWFAVTLYVALLFDVLMIWSVGFQPILASICIFVLALTISVFARRYAKIRIHETGIQYTDLVQVVDVSWVRIRRVHQGPQLTEIRTDSPLVQIQISCRHRSHGETLASMARRQAAFGFEISPAEVCG